jgi:hypothetical protein
MENSKNSNFGIDYLKGLYTNTTLVTKEPQPFYILARDTIKSFLHEKLDLLRQRSMFVTYLGVEITLIAALLTSSFKDFWFIKANIIQGTFIAFSLIIGFFMIKSAITSLRNFKSLKVDSLTNDLGEKGTIIRPIEIKQNDDNLVVINSKYFTNNKSYDTTKFLNSKIVNNRLDIQISNEIIGIDPDPKTPKQLFVEYELNGLIKSITIQEGDKLLLP